MEAIQVLTAFTFDLLILDLETSGLDGLLFLSIVRRIAPKLSLMAISGRPYLHERELQHQGVLCHLVDPFSETGMEQVVRTGLQHAAKR